MQANSEAVGTKINYALVYFFQISHSYRWQFFAKVELFSFGFEFTVVVTSFHFNCRLFGVLSAVLHIGNVEFTPVSGFVLSCFMIIFYSNSIFQEDKPKMMRLERVFEGIPFQNFLETRIQGKMGAFSSVHTERWSNCNML